MGVPYKKGDHPMSNSNPLTDSPKSLFTHYAVHTVLGMVAMSSAIFIDGLFIGRWLGSDVMAAISLVWPIIGFTFGFFYMIVIGGCAAIGNRMGAGNQKEANQLLTQITLLIMVVSLVAVIIGIWFSAPLVQLLTIPSELQRAATTYFSIIMIWIPFFGLNTLTSYSSRIAGFPKVYGAVMATSAGLNIALDALLIVGFSWGVEGAAMATGVSQLGGLIVGIYQMSRNKTALTFQSPNIPLRILVKAIGNGISEFFTEISYSIQALMVNAILIQVYGANGVTSYVIIGYFVNLAAMAFFGFAEAAQPLMSQNNGAKQHHRVQTFLKLAIEACLILGICIAIVILLFHTPVTKIFIRSKDHNFVEIIKLVKDFVWLFFPVFIFMGLGICFSSYFTSLERGGISATISLLRLLIFPVLFLTILKNLLPPPWFILAFPLSEFAAGVVGYLFWKKESLQKRRRQG